MYYYEYLIFMQYIKQYSFIIVLMINWLGIIIQQLKNYIIYVGIYQKMHTDIYNSDIRNIKFI